MAASTTGANPTASSQSANPSAVAELFKTMSYGPAPEGDNVVQVTCKYGIAQYFLLQGSNVRK